ncbi:hypothetical protein ATANTOWER_011689 [Ataeniobius toweri]|uniref:Uncharacterized protein n=1 Tax=Ataeniobius toweri TaxID=208326 RepID=A0ABU7BY40_9TELE|nr:hypothetical protein [Ataeniobius toweri]
MEPFSVLDDTLPLTEDLSLPPVMDMSERGKTIVVVHRGQILKELIQVFSKEKIINDNVTFKVILPDGKLEKAVDDGGVLRDVLSEFGMTFMSSAQWGMTLKCHTCDMTLDKENGKV